MGKPRKKYAVPQAKAVSHPFKVKNVGRKMKHRKEKVRRDDYYIVRLRVSYADPVSQLHVRVVCMLSQSLLGLPNCYREGAD